MARVGKLLLVTTVDPTFLASVRVAVAALEALGEQLKRTDLVKVEIVSEDDDG